MARSPRLSRKSLASGRAQKIGTGARDDERAMRERESRSSQPQLLAMACNAAGPACLVASLLGLLLLGFAVFFAGAAVNPRSSQESRASHPVSPTATPKHVEQAQKSRSSTDGSLGSWLCSSPSTLAIYIVGI